VTVLVEVRGLEKRFGPIQALRDTHLKITRGKITTLLGPSGSGKTTLLRIIGGLETPTQGVILYDNTPLTNSNRHLLRNKITMVFQKTVLFNTTVFKNIAFGLNVRGFEKGEIEDRVYKVLQKVRMENYADRPAKKLSGGEQQRVSLARALVINPELLLLDEPTANLDVANATMIEEIIKDLKGTTTMVIATHNIHQAKRLSNWAVFLFESTVVEQDEPEKLFAHPADIRARKFVDGEFYF